MKIERIYNVKLKYTPGLSDPAKIFLAYSNTINSFRKFDIILGKTLNYSTKCKQTLEDIQFGSISSKIKELFECPDDELSDISKPLEVRDVDNYVSHATNIIFDTINKGKKIDSPKQLDIISKQIDEIARNSSVGQLISYSPPANNEIIDVIKSFSDSVQLLTDNEELEYQKDDTIIIVPRKIEVDVQKIETELKTKFLTSQRELILKIKDLHFLGNAKWGFKHGNKNIEAKIEDNEWSNNFYNDKIITLHPGDSLDVMVELYEEYDKYGKLIKEEYTIVKVNNIISGGTEDE
jgi:ASC-1-like (ASCH) protein